ncbi:MAG TPA: GIY-YIG nuclease family protein [bacterium]|jgi:putative endonuclease|nr:GIY-YIG nuclease family protein [bacterium]
MPYYVYLTSTKNNTAIYTGVTNDLKRRIAEHKSKNGLGFTKKCNVDKLVFYEAYDEIIEAIKREKQIKGGSRQKKIDLIYKMNKNWQDLAEKL